MHKIENTAQNHRSDTEPVRPTGKLARTRHKLVRAVRDEIAENGGFSAERVALRAGTSTPTFYNHFATKDDALAAAYEQMMLGVVDMAQRKCQIERLLDEGLQVLVADWVLMTGAFFRENVRLSRLAQAAIDRSKTMRDLFREHEARTIEVYRRFIELGQAACAIRQGDPDAMASTLTITAQSWHHQLVQNVEAGDELHRELTGMIVAMLQPPAEMPNPLNLKESHP